MQTAPDMSEFTITVEPTRRRVLFLAAGELDGATFRASMGRWVQGAAGLLGFDRLYDLRRYTGTVSNDDVRHIGRLMREAGADTAEGRTVFVSADPGFAFWAGSMQLELPKRPMQVVRTLDAAEAVLAEAR
jgi:hypothetical protein